MTKHQQSEPNAQPASDGGSSEWPTMNDIRIHEAVKKWSEPADSTPAQPASEAVIPSLQKCCMMRAPDNTGRTCDKPAGHDGPHWTYGMDGKEWPAAPAGEREEADTDPDQILAMCGPHWVDEETKRVISEAKERIAALEASHAALQAKLDAVAGLEGKWRTEGAA
jgi:hypothetical protein